MKLIKYIIIALIIAFAIITIFFKGLIAPENLKLISLVLLFMWVSVMLLQRYKKKR